MSDSLRAILSHKKIVDEQLISYLTERKAKLSNKYLGDSIDRLLPFVTSGKTTRGSLAVYIYSLFRKNLPPSIYKAAAALELYHSGLLIHDDIGSG